MSHQQQMSNPIHVTSMNQTSTDLTTVQSPILKTTTSNSISPSVLKPQSRLKLSVVPAMFLAAVLCSLPIIMFHLPQSIAFPTSLRYPKCGHIVLVSDRRHGSTWFISNAEGCLSVNGSYGDLFSNVEIWNFGNVKTITLENAIDLVRFETSVKIFPDALYEHGKDVRAFLETMRDLQVPVFVLTRDLERSFASLQTALKTKSWNLDNGGAVVEWEFKAGKSFWDYKNKTETYFKDIKKLMGDIGIGWDEVQYETILSHRVILGKTAKCYIRNCNFK